MYIVSRGLALRGAKVYKGGMHWGEDILLNNKILQHLAPAMAMSYLAMYTLDGPTLIQTLEAHPECSARVMSLRIRWIIRRAFVELASVLRNITAKNGETFAHVRDAKLFEIGVSRNLALGGVTSAFGAGAPQDSLAKVETSVREEVQQLREEMRAHRSAAEERLERLEVLVSPLSRIEMAMEQMLARMGSEMPEPEPALGPLPHAKSERAKEVSSQVWVEGTTVRDHVPSEFDWAPTIAEMGPDSELMPGDTRSTDVRTSVATGRPDGLMA